MGPLRASIDERVLPLRTRLGTGAGQLDERTVLLLRVVDAAGATGVGEAAPLPWAGTETLDVCRTTLHAAAGDLRNPVDRATTPAAAAAIELALLDLETRAAGLPLTKRFSTTPATDVGVNALLAGSTVPALAAAATEHVSRGFRTLKVKVAAGAKTDFQQSLRRDLQRVEAVRTAVGSAVRIRLDANGGWSSDQADEALRALGAFVPEFVEEPIALGRAPSALAGLRRATGIPIAGDESITDLSALQELIAARCLDVVVLKPMRLGGLRPTLACARLAQEAGLPVVITTFLGSAVERAAALHLAAAIAPDNPRDLDHGLATGSLLTADVGMDPPVVGGRMTVPVAPGHGVQLS